MNKICEMWRFLRLFSKINVHILHQDPDPFSDYNILFQNVRYLFARGRLEGYEELKDSMFEGGVGTQDERQVSW